MKILFEQSAEVFFRRAGRGTVIVGQVEMRDAEIEGTASDGASIFEEVAATEVVPPAKGYLRKFKSAVACTVIGHGVVTRFGCKIGHRSFSLLEYRWSSNSARERETYRDHHVFK